jgi:RNA polymerase sigma-70 factor (ECF subfamily)
VTGAPTSAVEARFREVFVHLPEVIAYLRRRGSRDPEAVGAEVLVIAWRKLADVPADDARPWLFATARNLLLAEWRKASAADGRDALPEMAREVEPEVQLLDPELERCLRALSVRDREALLLVAWEDLTPALAARSLGVSQAAFRIRLHRSRKRLCSLLEAGEGTAAVPELEVERS